LRPDRGARDHGYGLPSGEAQRAAARERSEGPKKAGELDVVGADAGEEPARSLTITATSSSR